MQKYNAVITTCIINSIDATKRLNGMTQVFPSSRTEIRELQRVHAGLDCTEAPQAADKQR